MVICLQRGTNLHMAQLLPMSCTVSCFGKIQIGFTFLVSGHPGIPGQTAVKWVLFVLEIKISSTHTYPDHQPSFFSFLHLL